MQRVIFKKHISTADTQHRGHAKQICGRPVTRLGQRSIIFRLKSPGFPTLIRKFHFFVIFSSHDNNVDNCGWVDVSPINIYSIVEHVLYWYIQKISKIWIVWVLNFDWLEKWNRDNLSGVWIGPLRRLDLIFIAEIKTIKMLIRHN